MDLGEIKKSYSSGHKRLPEPLCSAAKWNQPSATATSLGSQGTVKGMGHVVHNNLQSLSMMTVKMCFFLLRWWVICLLFLGLSTQDKNWQKVQHLLGQNSGPVIVSQKCPKLVIIFKNTFPLKISIKNWCLSHRVIFAPDLHVFTCCVSL